LPPGAVHYPRLASEGGGKGIKNVIKIV
jgi:hypothetical protein